jgi:anti-sigma B factor antagonist
MIDMDTTVEVRQNVAIVRISGSIDSTTAAALQQVFDGELKAERVFLVAAMGDVEYTSSAGLRVLLGTMKGARSRGGDLRLAAPRREVLKVLDLSGFTGIVKIFDTVEDALEGFAE